ncbi:MAG TPA: hypothetical protein VNH22_13050 [Blastocatellia bacterium]|nr:hypothetical protein [Blastocatellia bacterium]
MRNRRFKSLLCLVVATLCPPALAPALNAQQPGSPADQTYEYRLLATTRTSTMQKEMNEAAAQGFRFGGVMGGETAFGGSEVVVTMIRDDAPEQGGRFQYRLLATSKTSTMQKEMQQAGDEGFEYKGQTVFSTTFGGKEVVVILERDRNEKARAYDYKLLATSKTSTMQKELAEAGRQGYSFVGVTVAETAFGGKEVVSILRKPR